MTSTCTTLLNQLRTQWDYTTAGVLADAFFDADDPFSAALWYVLANPADDERRLAFAAECEPRDAARAEFVRVQVELAKNEKGPVCFTCGVRHTQTCSHGRRIPDLRRRERELWHQLPTDLCFKPHGFTLGVINPIATEFGIEPSGKCHVSRGFVSRVTCSAANWQEHGPEIRLCQPIERVKLTTWPGRSPGWEVSSGEFEMSPDATVRYSTFPGISFELPTNYNPAFDYMDDFTYQPRTRRIDDLR